MYLLSLWWALKRALSYSQIISSLKGMEQADQGSSGVAIPGDAQETLGMALSAKV